jgi:hypothetical protein
MIPFLTYPLALLGLAALPALAAIYVVRNRYRRRQVSSLMLWRFHVQSKAGGAKIHRLQLPLLFFLELMALALLVTAATGPRWKLPQSARPMIIILDDSFSMRAEANGESAQARAREFLRGLFRRQAPPSARLILAGPAPRLAGPAAHGWGEVEKMLPEWSCRAPSCALDSALTLAAELGRLQANILVLTDHKPAEEKISNPRLEWRAFGQPLDNLAVINASRTPFGQEDRCLLEIANYSAATRSTHLVTQIGTNTSAAGAVLVIGPRQTQRVVFNLPANAETLHATLPPDALAEDNAIELPPPIRRRVRVNVALTNQAVADLVNRTVDATGLRASLNASPELTFTDGPRAARSNEWNVLLASHGATNAFTGPFILDPSHPLSQGLVLDGVVWSAAARTNAPGEIPVILAGNTPLVSVRDEAVGPRQLTLNLDPALSTLQNTPAWPVLFWNILSWRVSEMPGLAESSARLGTAVTIKTARQPLTLIRPDGSRETFPRAADTLSLETTMQGMYTVVLGNSTNRFAVNALAADESDLSTCVTGEWGRWSEDTERRLEETSAGWFFGLLALGLLSAHLYLAAGAKGGA